MKLAAFFCVFIGIVQFVFTRQLMGLVWLIAAAVLFYLDYRIGE